MSLAPIRELLGAALDKGYAVGYFESWNLESLQGVIDAAEATRSPIIVGFNGAFLTAPSRLADERIAWHGALGRAAAESAGVPCGLIFNECPLDAALRQAVTAGFNLVMLADPEADYEAYERRTAELATFAHTRGAAVEAEIGELPCGADGKGGSLTDPGLAGRFVKATQVDVLSVSVGNVHIMVGGTGPLDLEHLAKIRSQVSAPLGLHGGTGIAADSLREAIKLGVAKVAFGTYLKQRYLAALRKALGNAERNPHRLLGMGGVDDVMVAGRLAVRDAVLERIELLGCCGRA